MIFVVATLGLLVIAITDPPLTASWVVAIMLLAVAIDGWMIDNAKQEILDGLAKGKAPQGTREQGRETPRSAREPQGVQGNAATLSGHWHNYEWGKPLWATPHRAGHCKLWEAGVGPDCILRDPRSSDTYNPRG